MTSAAGAAEATLTEGSLILVTALSTNGYLAVATSIDPASTSSLNLDVSLPPGFGILELMDASDGTIVYKPQGGSTWTDLAPNTSGVGSVALPPGRYDVGKRCAGGSIVDQSTERVRSGRTQTEGLTTSCP